MNIRVAAAIGIGLVLLAPCARAEQTSELAPRAAAPDGQPRTALVIGNGAYASAPLRNPVNDARAVGRALAETGFSVRLLEDASEAGMRRAIRAFGDAIAQTGGVGLFYYAGHAMQLRGRNFLIPVNADIQREDEVEDQAVDANLVLGKMDSAKNSLNIVVLDACRNNPFQRSFRSAAQGLAQMDAPSGTLIAFATAPGSVAADGDGENGLYTSHLLRAIKEPGLPIEQLFKKVRIGVTRDTNDRQVPWESSSLKGNFYFVAPAPGRVSEGQRRRQDEAVARAVGEAEARAASERAALEDKMKALMAQLLARQQSELDAERAKRGKPSAAGKAASSEAAPGASANVGPGAHRVAVGDRWTYQRWRKSPASGDQLVSDLRSGRARPVTVEIKAVQDGAILETTTREGGEPTEWVHRAGRYLLGIGSKGSSSIFTLSPYLLAYEKPAEGERWPIEQFQRMRSCSEDPRYDCRFRARVVGRERVSVPAGSFDALRIEVEQTAHNKRDVATRIATFWYSEAVKRHVKVTWRKVEGVWTGPDGEDALATYSVH
jgi:uncharacterized caspase-like protein